MKKLFRKMAKNVKDNLECKETRVVTALCLGFIALNVTILALSPLIK